MSASLSDLLVRYGFSALKAELWTRFVDEVVAILLKAGDELRSSSGWAAFIEKRGALSVPRARKRRGVIERTPIEDAITAELGHIARRIRAGLPSGHFLRLNEVAFETERLVESETRTGRHSRKVDFLIYAQAGDSPPELAIEAKPLRTPADISGHYLADEGIGCFFAVDAPYTIQPLAGMLAYSMNSEGRSLAAEVRAAVATFVPPPIGLDDVELQSTGGPVLCSLHDRSAMSLEPITIVHLEMRFVPESVAI